MIRKPNESERFDCLQLLYQSGPHMFRYFFNCHEPAIYDILSIFFDKTHVLFSRDNMLVKVKNDQVCGLLLCVEMKDIKKLEKNMGRYASAMIRVFGCFGIITLLFRSRLQRYIKGLEEIDEFYISNLAVFEAYQNQGIGKELLKQAEDLAKSKGYQKLSLLVETYNHHAKHIYELFGFKETSHVLFPKRYHKYGIEGYYKMVKRLA